MNGNFLVTKDKEGEISLKYYNKKDSKYKETIITKNKQKEYRESNDGKKYY